MSKKIKISEITTEQKHEIAEEFKALMGWDTSVLMGSVDLGKATEVTCSVEGKHGDIVQLLVAAGEKSEEMASFIVKAAALLAAGEALEHSHFHKIPREKMAES